MIIGAGDIAKALIEAGVDRPDVLFFASGVSNSSETRSEPYQRERNLYFDADHSLHLVYFSSLSIYYSDTIYARYKRLMEELITTRSNKSGKTIIRLGNITWGTNPNTIINYFKTCYSKGIQPELKDTYRYLITKDEFIYWVKMIRVGVNDIMNLPGEMVHVKEIWRRVTNGYY